MKKQKLLPALVGVGFMLIAGTASAAKSGKGGTFIGLEGSWDSINYIHYSSTPVEITPENEANYKNDIYKSTGKNYSGYLVFGKRYYFNNIVGYGIKSWVGYAQYRQTSNAYYESTYNYTDTISSNSIPFGMEAQLYLDLLNFNRGSIGLTLGAGYEATQFYNVIGIREQKTGSPVEIKLDDYHAASMVLDAALHYQIGARNRLEVGYKIKDYSKTAHKAKRVNSTTVVPYTVGFNVQDAVYLTYTFSF